jgi:hypothetical protein
MSSNQQTEGGTMSKVIAEANETANKLGHKVAVFAVGRGNFVIVSAGVIADGKLVHVAIPTK